MRFDERDRYCWGSTTGRRKGGSNVAPWRCWRRSAARWRTTGTMIHDRTTVRTRAVRGRAEDCRGQEPPGGGACWPGAGARSGHRVELVHPLRSRGRRGGDRQPTRRATPGVLLTTGARGNRAPESWRSWSGGDGVLGKLEKLEKLEKLGSPRARPGRCSPWRRGSSRGRPRGAGAGERSGRRSAGGKT